MSCVWDLPKTDRLDPTTQIQVRAARFMEEPIPTAPKSRYHSISGYDPSAVALRAEKLRISDFLEKPFSREIICNAVKKAIGSPKRASELSQADSPVPAVASNAPSLDFGVVDDVIGR
jgi:DNA-binding NtrC family response regulator